MFSPIAKLIKVGGNLGFTQNMAAVGNNLDTAVRILTSDYLVYL